jgi:hypothetical protein
MSFANNMNASNKRKTTAGMPEKNLGTPATASMLATDDGSNSKMTVASVITSATAAMQGK